MLNVIEDICEHLIMYIDNAYQEYIILMNSRDIVHY